MKIIRGFVAHGAWVGDIDVVPASMARQGERSPRCLEYPPQHITDTPAPSLQQETASVTRCACVGLKMSELLPNAGLVESFRENMNIIIKIIKVSSFEEQKKGLLQNLCKMSNSWVRAHPLIPPIWDFLLLLLII